MLSDEMFWISNALKGLFALITLLTAYKAVSNFKKENYGASILSWFIFELSISLYSAADTLYTK
jgi:hypothetical protein